MSLRGRREKRQSVIVEVYLLGVEDWHRTERAVTENVSPRGARIVTGYHWRTGDRLRIAGIESEFQEEARVVYHEAKPGQGFFVGLELGRSREGWWQNVPARGLVNR